ncbi:MAG: hypothetical protein MHMPM18_000089 [Marteilia pararefringens]
MILYASIDFQWRMKSENTYVTERMCNFLPAFLPYSTTILTSNPSRVAGFVEREPQGL